jgi:hypothetical protein
MHRYLAKTPKKEYPLGVRIVHNFYPGPHEEPGRDRELRMGGFRVWVTDDPTRTSSTATAAGSTGASTTAPWATSTPRACATGTASRSR